MPGTLFVVATPIGHLDDISARALAVLRRVSLIAAEDTRRTARLLAHYGIATPTTSLHEHNERQKSASVLDRLARGEDVAIVSDAGTPTVSDPGEYLVRAAIDAGVRVESIPGPSAIMAILAASGMPASRFTFLGFPPPKGTARRTWFETLAQTPHTVVFFEAPHRIVRTLTELQAAAGDVRVAVGRELTKAHEQLVIGPISGVLAGPIREQGEFTVAASIGQTTNTRAADAPTGSALWSEFCQMTDNGDADRRAAIAFLARKYGLPARSVYAALEDGKKSAK